MSINLQKYKIVAEAQTQTKSHHGFIAVIDALRNFCRQEGLDDPEGWLITPDRYVVPDPYIMDYAVALRLSQEDRWEPFDAMVVFILRDLSDRENRKAEKDKLRILIEQENGKPILLTRRMPDDEGRRADNRRFYEEIGYQLMPVRWTDRDGHEYEVFVSGHLEMGGFAGLMDRVEYIGSELVYCSYVKDSDRHD